MDDRDEAETGRDLQQERALEAIAAINAGANPSHEAYTLANEFTDRHTARFGMWLRRVFRRHSD